MLAVAIGVMNRTMKPKFTETNISLPKTLRPNTVAVVLIMATDGTRGATSRVAHITSSPTAAGNK